MNTTVWSALADSMMRMCLTLHSLLLNSLKLRTKTMLNLRTLRNLRSPQGAFFYLRNLKYDNVIRAHQVVLRLRETE